MVRHKDCHRLLESVAYLLVSTPETALRVAVMYIEELEKKELEDRVAHLWEIYQKNGWLPDEIIDDFLLPVINSDIDILDDKGKLRPFFLARYLQRVEMHKKGKKDDKRR